MNTVLSSLLIGIIIIGFFMVGYSYTVEQIAGPSGYNVNYQNEYAASFNTITNVTTEIKENYDTIKNISINPSDFVPATGAIVSLTKNAIRLPSNLFESMIESVSSIFGFPEWISGFAIVLLMILILFAFFAIVLRFFT